MGQAEPVRGEGGAGDCGGGGGKCSGVGEAAAGRRVAARVRLRQKWRSERVQDGSALGVFKRMVVAQGGDASVLDSLEARGGSTRGCCTGTVQSQLKPDEDRMWLAGWQDSWMQGEMHCT